MTFAAADSANLVSMLMSSGFTADQAMALADAVGMCTAAQTTSGPTTFNGPATFNGPVQLPAGGVDGVGDVGVLAYTLGSGGQSGVITVDNQKIPVIDEIIDGGLQIAAGITISVIALGDPGNLTWFNQTVPIVLLGELTEDLVAGGSAAFTTKEGNSPSWPVNDCLLPAGGVMKSGTTFAAAKNYGDGLWYVISGNVIRPVVFGTLSGTLSQGGSQSALLTDGVTTITVYDQLMAPGTGLASSTKIAAVIDPNDGNYYLVAPIPPPIVVTMQRATLVGSLSSGGSATATTAGAVSLTVYDYMIPSGMAIAGGTPIFIVYMESKWWVVGSGACAT